MLTIFNKCFSCGRGHVVHDSSCIGNHIERNEYECFLCKSSRIKSEEARKNSVITCVECGDSQPGQVYVDYCECGSEVFFVCGNCLRGDNVKR